MFPLTLLGAVLLLWSAIGLVKCLVEMDFSYMCRMKACMFILWTHEENRFESVQVVLKGDKCCCFVRAFSWKLSFLSRKTGYWFDVRILRGKSF